VRFAGIGSALLCTVELATGVVPASEIDRDLEAFYEGGVHGVEQLRLAAASMMRVLGIGSSTVEAGLRDCARFARALPIANGAHAHAFWPPQ
jgi:hypothetical protein